jgi:hypothetical protein
MVIEEQVDEIFLLAKRQPVLAIHEAKTVAQFEKKIFHPLLSQPVRETGCPYASEKTGASAMHFAVKNQLPEPREQLLRGRGWLEAVEALVKPALFSAPGMH